MTIDDAITVLMNIKHDALTGAIQRHYAYNDCRPLGHDEINAIEKAIAVMYGQDGKIGTWKKDTDNTRTWDRVRFYCSVCGDWQTYGETDYCSHCGARMKKPETKTPYNYGYWLKDKDNGFTCDDCGCWVVRPSAYCPDCGREMRVLHPEETE